MTFPNVKTAVDTLDTAYRAAMARFRAASAALIATGAEIDRIGTDRALSYIGRNQKRADLRERQRQQRQQLEQIAKDALAELAGIRTAILDSFDRWKVKPSDIDRDALEILDSGILKPSEIPEFAERYARNVTMKRLIGQRLARYADEKQAAGVNTMEITTISALAARLQATENPVESLLESYATITESCFRTGDDGDEGTFCDAKLYSGALSDALHRADDLDNGDA